MFNIKKLSGSIMPAMLLLLFVLSANAQSEKSFYWNTIQKFRKQDSLQAPPKNAILFVGSSSFTNWHNVGEFFPGYTIINRGLGGAHLPDVKVYLEEVNYPPKVKQIVIYCGDNDIISGSKAQVVLERFQQIVELIRKDLPRVPIAYISIKGCPGRIHALPIVKEANALIKQYASTQKNIDFIDIYTPTMEAGDVPLKDIYVEDGVHLNQKGYGIWATAIKPHLKK